MGAKKGVILVTGCSGRIGTRVVDRFAKDYQVVGFDLQAPKHPNPAMDFVKMDLSSEESIHKGFAYVKNKYGDSVVSMVHLAAYYNFTGGGQELYDKITVRGSERILEALQEFHCEQFIFSSTQLVMGTCKVGEKITEESPVSAKWDYPISKIKTEKIIHAKRGKIPAVILRIVGCYDDECHSIPISNQIQRIFENQFAARVFPGNIHHGAPFMHLDDLTDCIEKTIQKRKELPEEVVFLVGEDRTMSVDQLQRRISSLIRNKEFTTFRIPKIVAKIGAWLQWKLPLMPETFIRPWMIDLADDNWTLDISKIKKLLGWQPKHFVGDVLPKMISDLKKDPLGWYQMNLLKPPASMLKKYAKKHIRHYHWINC